MFSLGYLSYTILWTSKQEVTALSQTETLALTFVPLALRRRAAVGSDVLRANGRNDQRDLHYTAAGPCDLFDLRPRSQNH